MAGALESPSLAICPPPVIGTAGVTHLINFESYPSGFSTMAGDLVTDQFSSVGACFTSGLNATPTIFDLGTATYSPPRALVNSFPSSSDIVGSRNYPLQISFTTGMQTVSMRIGWGGPPPFINCTAPWPGVTLTAYGRTGPGSTGVVVTSTLPPPLSDSVTTSIFVIVPDPAGQNITSVILNYGDCYVPETIDQLVLTESTIPPITDTTAPVVDIVQPLPGQIFNGNFVIPPVTGTIFEDSGLPPTIAVNGVFGTVTSDPTPGLFNFTVPGVPLDPPDGAHLLTAVATNAAGLIGTDSVTVTRALPFEENIDPYGLQISQTGIIDPPALTLPFVQATLAQGKLTMVRTYLGVFSAGFIPTWVDYITLDVLDPGGSTVGTVPPSSYSFPTTALLPCSPLICGVNFFVPGDLLEGAPDTIERRFRINYFVQDMTGLLPVGSTVLGPYVYNKVSPFSFLVSPVEIPWDPNDETMMANSLDMMERTYPGRDGAGFFSALAPASSPRGMEWVSLSPVDLADTAADWRDDWVLYDVDLRGVAGDGCGDTTVNPMPGFRLGRQTGYPEDTDGNGLFSGTEVARFCPTNDTAGERNGRLKDFLRSETFAIRDDYNVTFTGSLTAPISTPGVYTNEGSGPAIPPPPRCGGSASDWAWNVGGSQPNCVRVVGQEYTHTLGILHSRNQLVLNGITVPELPGCGPLVGDETAACDGIIPTAYGAGYNLLDRTATSTPFSYMTTRDGAGRDNYLNCFLRNPEFTYLAQEHAVGWYTSSALTEPEALVVAPLVAGPAPSPAAANPWKILGSVNLSTNQVGVLWAGPVPAGTPLTPAGSTPFVLRVRNGSGAILLNQILAMILSPPTVHPDDNDVDPPMPSDSALLSAVIDMPPGAARVELLRETLVLWAANRGAFPPRVSVVSPAGGSFPAGSHIDIVWTASDSDPGTVLYFDLSHSPDGGATFIPLGNVTQRTDWQWRTRLAPGGQQGLVRVTASDGFELAADVNNVPFVLQDSAPLVRILSPGPGRSILQDEELALRAFAFDPEDGMLDGASVFWVSNLDGALGSGASRVLQGLRAGTHIITANAVDSAQHLVSRSVSVIVEADTDRDGLPNAYELANGLNPKDPHDSAGDPDGDGLNFIDERFLGTNPFSSDTDGDGLADGAEVRQGGDPLVTDSDGDGALDGADNCLLAGNSIQVDKDNDGAGDACDNCAGVVNGGQEDLDRDGLGDACDPDDDGDGAADAADCAPADPFAFALPGEVAGLEVVPGQIAGQAIVSWSASTTGRGAFYDVVGGFLDDLRPSGFASATCQISEHPGTQFTHSNNVKGKPGYYFLVRERNACGIGTWGPGSGGQPRNITACP
ncbi:MAG TPA: hypothetical protein VGK94_15155 [Candidatus Polarisedimenticolia bacterium]